jgi:putative DNA primase/helicase
MKRAKTVEALARHPERIRRIREAPATGIDQVAVLENLTDLGNARRLVAIYGQDLRYCHAFGKWLFWDGARWKSDGTDEIRRRMFDVVHRMHDQAAYDPSRAQRDALENWARRSESEGKICAAISLAQSQQEFVVTPDELDQHPWLLNCTNGTLDLQSLELREHRREDFLTQQTGIPFDRSAACPQWETFLSQITGNDAQLQAFLQRATGYSLTGVTREQCIFLLYGTGQNGKTTFLEGIRTVMGDYQAHAEFSTFLHDRSGAIRNDLAALRGKRFVSSIEANPGDRLDESVVKTVTGGDPITARFLHKEYFTYSPTYKVFLGVNDKPHIRGSSKGTWRRIKLIPFEVAIPEEKQDKHLLEKLRSERPGILAWAVQGLEKWKEPGLQPPDAVVSATEEYREEMDVVGSFIDECCEKETGASVMARDLYSEYRSYCERNGERVLTQRDLGLILKQRGYVPDRTGKSRARSWKGLRLRNLLEP